MDDKSLFKIAFVCTLIGIFILFMISNEIEVEEKTIDNINMENLGETVKVSGVVEKVTDTGSVMILKISQENYMDIVVFKNKDNVSFSKGDYLEIEGKSDEYNGKIELIAEEIKKYDQ